MEKNVIEVCVLNKGPFIVQTVQDSMPTSIKYPFAISSQTVFRELLAATENFPSAFSLLQKPVESDLD